MGKGALVAGNAYQSQENEDIVDSEPSFDYEARVHAQGDGDGDEGDEDGVDDDEGIAACYGVGVVWSRPGEEHFERWQLHLGDLDETLPLESQSMQDTAQRIRKVKGLQSLRSTSWGIARGSRGLGR